MKEVLIQECQAYDLDQAKSGVSFEAFKALQKVLIMKMKQQTCWTILRFFGYNDKLEINESDIIDGFLTEEELLEIRNIELSDDAINYLRRIFEAYKNREKGKLTEKDMERIFATLENNIPWKVKSETMYEDGLTYENWIALWQMHISSNTIETFKNLIQIGYYCGKIRDSIKVHRYKLSD